MEMTRRLAIALVCLMALAGGATHRPDVKQATTYVYICTGPQSKRYHKASTCRGLSNCSKEIRRVSLEKARSMGRTPCKWCHKSMTL